MINANFVTRESIAATLEICVYLNVFADDLGHARISLADMRLLFENFRDAIGRLQALERRGLGGHDRWVQATRNAGGLQAFEFEYMEVIEWIIGRRDEADRYHGHLEATDPKRLQALFDKEASRNG